MINFDGLSDYSDLTRRARRRARWFTVVTIAVTAVALVATLLRVRVSHTDGTPARVMRERTYRRREWYTPRDLPRIYARARTAEDSAKATLTWFDRVERAHRLEHDTFEQNLAQLDPTAATLAVPWILVWAGPATASTIDLYAQAYHGDGTRAASCHVRLHHTPAPLSPEDSAMMEGRDPPLCQAP